MKTLLITALLALSLLFTTGCIRDINTNKHLINAVLEYYPDYQVEIIDHDPNSITINIRK